MRRPLLLAAATVGAAPLLGPAALAEEHVVTMAGMAYAPAELQAEVGDTIRFVNDDTVAHNVFVPTAGFGVDLGRQDPGADSVLMLGKAGAFEVECVFHPDMLLRVSVSE